MTTIRNILAHASVLPRVPVQLLVLLELKTLVEGLSANLADRADFASVLAHMIQEVLLLAKHIAAGVALVLDATRVDGHVFFEAIEAGELSRTDGAAEESTVVLLGISRVMNLRNLV